MGRSNGGSIDSRAGKRLATLLGALLLCSCGAQRLEQRGAPTTPFDVVIVPGCPSNDDGSLTRCQMGRALWAAVLWERGWARNFIVSGDAVHSPYVEAEALAEALAALGVPAERIFLEPHALHTDENMLDSWQLVQLAGWHRVAVASSRGHAAWGCQLLIDGGQDCRALSFDVLALEARAARSPGVLAAVRSRRVVDYVPLDERERRLVAAGHRRRPPSLFLYPSLFFARSNGKVWRPEPVAEPRLQSWADRPAPLRGGVVQPAR